MNLRPIYRFRGDEDACRDRLHEANLFLEEMLISSNMVQGHDTYVQHRMMLEDGTTIMVRKTYGRPIVTIYSPETEVEEEAETSLVQHPQYIYAHAITLNPGFEALATVYNCRSKAVAVKTLNPDYGLTDSNGDLLYPYAPEYWGIENPFYGLLKAGVDGVFSEDTPDSDLLFPDATEYFTFPQRVLITAKERKTSCANYYYNNPRGTYALKVYTGTLDTRLGGYITAVNFTSAGANVRVGNTFDIPAQQQYDRGTRAYIAAGQGGRIEITSVTSDGKVAGYKILANGTGYVTSAEVLSLNKSIKITLEAAPVDETLHFHKWYTENCRDGNVNASIFQPTTDLQPPGVYPWTGSGVDHNGNQLHAAHAVAVDPPYDPLEVCSDTAPDAWEYKGTAGDHRIDTWTTNLYEPDQLREVHQIGLLTADRTTNQNLIISADKEDRTDDKEKVVYTCSLEEPTPEADGRGLCGEATPVCGPYNWPPPPQPEFDNCIQALRECYWNAINGKPIWVLKASYDRSAGDNYLRQSDAAVLYDPILSESDAWPGPSQTWSQAWDKEIKIIQYLNKNMPYVGLGGMRFILTTGYTKGESTRNDTPLAHTIENPLDRYYWIINSDTLCRWEDSGVTGAPYRWTVEQNRWRLAYNSRYSDSTDTPEGGFEEQVGPYFMQLYVYAYTDLIMGQQFFTQNPTDLKVHASIIDLSPATTGEAVTCFYKNGDNETGLTWAANSAASCPEFEGVISALIGASGPLASLASVNASFLSYKKARTLLIDRAEGELDDTPPTGQEPDEV